MHFPPVEAVMCTLSNHELSGLQNWYDLDDVDCGAQYKNEFEAEAHFEVTKASILELYESQLEQLIDHQSERTLQVTHAETCGSMKAGRPTILERFRFTDGGDSAGTFIKNILAQYKRRQWDRNIVDLRLVSPVIDRTMVLIEQLSGELVPGHSGRELLMKRFVFRDQGCLFVYSSSVPDEVHSDEDSGRDDATRYTLIWSVMCFKKVGEDLIIERIK